jgi:hypothetical protein
MSELARDVWLVSGTVAAVVTGCAWAVLGPADALGALLGAALTLANFSGLLWWARRVGPAAGGGSRGRLAWMGANGARLLLVGTGTALAVARGWVGLAGVVLGLVVVPLGVVVAGLRSARTA